MYLPLNLFILLALFNTCSALRCDKNVLKRELPPFIDIAFVVVFFQAPTHLAHEIEASQCSYVWAAETHDLPLAVLAAVPVSLLNYIDSCVYQGDREGQLEQKHGMG